MDHREACRVRRELDELVDAGLDTGAFCIAAGALVARAVPSGAGEYQTPTWYALDPASLLINGVFGPDCTLDAVAQMRWEYIENDVNKSIDVTRKPGGVQTLHEVTGGNPWSSAIYRDYMYDHDLAQEMLVALRGADGHVWATVRLNRPRAMAAFASQTGSSCGRLIQAWRKASGADCSPRPCPPHQSLPRQGW